MIKVAIIGTGYIGPVHIGALRRVSGVRIVGVTDANAELAQKTAKKYDIEKVYKDYLEVVNDPEVDVVHVCSPNKFHYAMNKAAIERGKQVLSEKPLCMTLDEAKEITELAEAKGLVTGIDFCYRYYPVVLEAALRLRGGEAGPIRMATGTWFQDWLSKVTDYSWRLQRSESGESSVAADLGSHWFDLIQFVTGLHVTEVMADFSTLLPIRRKPKRQVVAFEKVDNVPYDEVKIEVEDYASILFRLSNGAPGSFTTCQAATGRRSELEFQVYGGERSYAWNQTRSTELWVGNRDKANETLIEGPGQQDPYSAAYTSLPAGHPMGYNDALLNLMNDFYDVIKGGGDAARKLPRPTFRTGYDEMRILKAIVQSKNDRAWVKVE